MTGNIRVLVVDDSAFMRKLLTEIIESDPECEVIKTAADGVEALKAVKALRPDVVTMDIELPEIDGLACLAYIMDEFPTPVVMVTGFSAFMGEETMKALEYGAVDLVRKPSGTLSRSMKVIKTELLAKIKLAARVDARKLKRGGEEVRKVVRKALPVATDKIVAIASSTGGPRALYRVIPELPRDLPAAVVVVQHMPAEFLMPFSQRLNSHSEMNVKLAEDHESIRRGTVLVLPDKCHVGVKTTGNGEEVIQAVPFGEEEQRLPYSSADELMISLAPVYGENATGVLLTGMGSDGTEGLRAIKERGGRTIVEDESTAIVYGMPKAAMEAGVVDKQVPLPRIRDEIISAVAGSSSEAGKL